MGLSGRMSQGGPAQCAWRPVPGRAGEPQPFPVHGPRPAGVHRDVTVVIARLGGSHPHRLVPAVHAGDRVGVDAGRSGSGGRRCRSTRSAECLGRWMRTVHDRCSAFHRPSVIALWLEIDGGHHAAALARLAFQPPAPHVMAAGDHPGPDPFGDPALATKWPISVSTRTRSPVRAMPSRPASLGWIQTGLVWASRRATWRWPSGCGSGWAAGTWTAALAGRLPAGPGARGS